MQEIYLFIVGQRNTHEPSYAPIATRQLIKYTADKVWCLLCRLGLWTGLVLGVRVGYRVRVSF